MADDLHMLRISHAPAEQRAVVEGHENPEGVGLYLRNLSKRIHGTPAQAAKKAGDNGVSFVAILAAWQDRKGERERNRPFNKIDEIRRYAEAFAKRGIDPWIWGFPRANGEAWFTDRMKAVLESTESIAGVLLDPEVYYKWLGRGTRRGELEADPHRPDSYKASQIAAAERLMRLTLDSLTERHGLGVTSYGIAGFHKNFPWVVFGAHGWGSPQLYNVSPSLVDKGIAQWRELGWGHIVPSVPSFGPKSGAELHDFLSTFVDGVEDVSGFIVWSWLQTRSDEWRTLARWADWFERGVLR